MSYIFLDDVGAMPTIVVSVLFFDTTCHGVGSVVRNFCRFSVQRQGLLLGQSTVGSCLHPRLAGMPPKFTVRPMPLDSLEKGR